MVTQLVSEQVEQQIERLARSLPHSAFHPERPLIDLELPLGVDRMLGKHWAKTLRPAAVLVGIRNHGDHASIILTVRSTELRAHAGQISFPGGRADEGEHFPVGTALREAEEEIGLPQDSVQVLGYLDDYPTISKYRVTPVVALVDTDTDFVPEPGEVSEVFELPLSLALNPDMYQKGKLRRMGVKYYELQYGDYRVWGATAGMLWNLAQNYSQYD